MSTFTDLKQDATSVDGFVNENGLITTRRNGPKPSWQYLVDGWESQFTTLFADGETQIDQVVTDLQTQGDAELSNLLIGITNQANSAIADIESDVSEKLEQLTAETYEAIEVVKDETSNAIESSQNRTNLAVDQLTNDANDLLDSIEQSALSRSKTSTPVALSEGQTEVTIAGFNASLSAYYVKDLNSDSPRYRLFSGVDEDYTFESVTTDTITLNQTYDAGTKVYAVSLDPAGAGVVKTESQFSSIIDLRLSDVPVGTVAVVPSLGNAKYYITTGVSPLIGDIDFSDTRVGVLLPSDTDSFDVRWFGAVSGAGIDQKEFFDIAAAGALEHAKQYAPSSTIGKVHVPSGLWDVRSKTSNKAIWEISASAEMLFPANNADSNADDVSYLSGKQERMVSRGSNFIHLGSTDSWPEKYRPASSSISQLNVVSDDGRAAIYGHSRASDRTNQGAGCIGVGALAWADQETDFDYSVWAGYFESAKFYNVNGNAFAIESNVTNYTGQIQAITPNEIPNGMDRYSVNLWTGGPVGDSGEGTPEDYNIAPSSAAMVISPGGKPFDNGGFDKGIVFLDVSFLNGSKEILAYSESHRMMAYSDTGVQLSYTETIDAENNGVGRYDLRVKKENGTWQQYMFATGSFSSADDSVSIGAEARRFRTGFFVNAPNVVSDRDKKTEIRGLTENELSAGLELARNVKFYKWISEVNQKGTDDSYLHASVIAQEAYDILTDNNLDASKYGLVSNQSGNWSVLPTELSMLMSAALVAEQDKIKLRLDALED